MPRQQSGKQHRLTEMLVEEVSNVDRAANKRRFLVVKRDDGDSMTTRLIPNGDGTFKKVAVSKDESGAPAAEGETNTAGAAAGAEGAAVETDKKFPPGAKAPPFGKKPGSGGGDSKEDEDDDDDKGKGESKKPWEKGAARKAAAAALTDCVSKLVGVAQKFAEGVDLDDAVAHAEVGKAIADLNKALTDASQPITKVGRRMAKDRLARFDKALAELSGILKEVMDAPEEEEAEKAAPTEKSFEEPGAAGANGTTDKTDAKLVEQISNLKSVAKRQERELQLLRKQDVKPNSAKPEVERTAAQKSDDEVEWPLDMNRPITRETTRKEFSFYDD